MSHLVKAKVKCWTVFLASAKTKERMNRKRKQKKKKKNTTVHINLNEPSVDQKKMDNLKPNLMASGTKYPKTPEQLITHTTYTTGPFPMENDHTRFHRLDPPLYKPNLLTMSDSRISVPRGNSVKGLVPMNFGSTRDIRIAGEKPNDFTAFFSLNDNEKSNAASLNKFCPTSANIY